MYRPVASLLQHTARMKVTYRRLLVSFLVRGADHMLSEKSQWTQNGTTFVDLDWPLNASSPLSASAELLVFVYFGSPTSRAGGWFDTNLCLYVFCAKHLVTNVILCGVWRCSHLTVAVLAPIFTWCMPQTCEPCRLVYNVIIRPK